MSALELWYEAPAQVWTEALPVGNGRLGAMVFGGTAHERLQLNEDTLWTGGPYVPINPEALTHLDAVRKLIFDGRYAEAEALAELHLMATPRRQMSYQPAGDLWIGQPVAAGATHYRRSLDLDTAVARTRFVADATTYTRDVFASAVDGVIVVHMTADRPGSITVDVSVTSEQPGGAEPAGVDCISWRGNNRSAYGVDGRLRFRLAARIIATAGTVTPAGANIRVTGADELLILIDAATSFRRFDDTSGDPDAAVDDRLGAATRKSAAELRSAHVADHQQLFRRLAIDLGRTPAADLPTDRRIAANAETHDPALAALYVQFGRYLMIASSRPGTEAATLQGIWNDLVEPPWGSKYTSNINLQMTYWLADPGNLEECVEPLIRLAEEASATGAEVASAHYGARGWVLHHNTDIWRATGPIDGARWGLWPTGAAWLCAQLWDHAVFADRPEALVRRLYPLIAGAARFVLDALTVLPGTDLLVTNPSVSPENVHPRRASVCAGPAMDRQIVRDLFDALAAAAAQLGLDDELVAEASRARARLPGDRIGHAGQLQEWLDDWDMDVPEIHHRHVSHLYGLYPSLQIDADTTPELAAAARRSLEIRGDEATGWGVGWRINLWARLCDGDRAYAVVQRLLSPERTYPNLFDAHPPFQIDGNFGGAAGILEMLVQSDGRIVRLLPALPAAWPAGRLTGVRCREGLVVEVEWSDSRVRRATITSQSDQIVVVRYGGETTTAYLAAGRPWVCSPAARRAQSGSLKAADTPSAEGSSVPVDIARRGHQRRTSNGVADRLDDLMMAPHQHAGGCRASSRRQDERLTTVVDGCKVGVAAFAVDEAGNRSIEVQAAPRLRAASVPKPLLFWVGASEKQFVSDRAGWRALAEPAVRSSDNDATATLWSDIGETRLLASIANRTGVVWTTDHGSEHPSLRIMVTAGELAVAYASFASDHSGVAVQLRALMRQVPTDQTFGVRRVACDALGVTDEVVGVKCGWFGLERAHAVTLVELRDRIVGAAVTTQWRPHADSKQAATHASGKPSELVAAHDALAGRSLRSATRTALQVAAAL